MAIFRLFVFLYVENGPEAFIFINCDQPDKRKMKKLPAVTKLIRLKYFKSISNLPSVKILLLAFRNRARVFSTAGLLRLYPNVI